MRNLLKQINLLWIANTIVLVANAQCIDQSVALPQFQTQTLYETKWGYTVPVSTPVGSPLRLLIILAEVNYDIGVDPNPTGGPYWLAHQLPVWAPTSANPHFIDNSISTNPQGLMTQYYYMASSGNYNVIGDYLLNPSNGGIFSADISTLGNGFNCGNLVSKVNIAMNGTFSTLNGFNSANLFDNYTMTGTGVQKQTPSIDNPLKYDYILVVWRNRPGFGNTGNTSPGGSIGNVIGYESDNWCQVGATAGGELPFESARHEFGHSMYGGNNFHCGGGGWGNENYFIPLVNGWSNMSLHGASLLTWNAWDRQRMGWQDLINGNQFLISTRDASGTTEKNGDLDVTNPANAGIYTLRDFVTTGDAIRIKLPFIDSGTEFPEYLWIENHNTITMNQCPFDKFIHQSYSCVSPAVFGIYSYMQVDKDLRESNNPYNLYNWNVNFADYLRPLTAEGFYDRIIESTTKQNTCVNTLNYLPFIKEVLPNAPPIDNPLTGSGDLDFLSIDNGIPNQLDHTDITDMVIENLNGVYNKNLFSNGHSRQAFTLTGNSKIGMGTNPSANSLENLVSYDAPGNLTAHNQRRIYLNGISIEILNQNTTTGEIKVQIRFDDVDIDKNVRWCADEIVLNPIPTPNNVSLNLKNGKQILIDHGKTATRMINPISFQGQQVFTSPTLFKAQDGSWINMEDNSTIIVDNGSSLIMQYGSRLDIGKDATLIVRNGSHLILDGGSLINVADRGRIIIEEGNAASGTTDADLQFFPNARINLNAFYAQLEIAGNLVIKDNATFTVLSAGSNTFTLGSVKFSSTDALSQNVIAGNNCNCGFVLRSNVQVRKMLYVTQETLYAPDNLVEFTLQNGCAVLYDNSRIKAPESNNCAINVLNARITSPNNILNTHRGYWLAGQQNVNIQYSNFMCGNYGIYANQVVLGNGLKMSHCSFTACVEGLYTYGKFVNMSYTVFNANTRGWAAEMMSEPSSMYYGGAVYNTEYGINYHSPGTSSLYIYDALIDHNYKGVIARNSILIEQCGSISHNDVFGIRLRNNAILRMGNMSVQPRVTAIDNGITIDCKNAKYFYLDYGENELEPHVPLTGTIINGTMIPGTNLTITAKNNQWNAALTSPVTLQDYVLTTGGNPITVSDPSPIASTLCGQANPPCPTCPPNQLVTYCPNCDEINTPDYINERLNNASADAIDMATDTSLADNYKLAIDRLNQILMYPLFSLSNRERYILDYDYMQMKEALGYAFLTGQLISDSSNITAQEYVNMVIDVQTRLINDAIEAGNYPKRLFTSLEKAQSYRIASRLYESMEVINDILNWVDIDDYDDVSRFQCHLQIEIDLAAGNINSEGAAIAMQNCGTSTYRETFQASLGQSNEQIQKESFQVKISPEKIEDYFTVSTNSSDFVNFKLIDVKGKLLFTKRFKGDADFPTSNLTNGIYLYEVINETGEVKTGKLIL